jgi:nucleotide-binding universal stress UspA family protein
MNRILVPYDFSKLADNALDFACQLAQKAKAKEILLLNVVEHPSESKLKTMGATSMDPMENIYFTKLVQLVEDKLKTKISNIDYSGVNVEYKIQLGNPYNTLAVEVAEEEVDMVIMGTSGAEGLEEFFVGSNAERVVRTAKAPVITLKDKAELATCKKIVFASNFVNIKESFVIKLKQIQNLLSGTLKLVKINTPASFTTTRHDLELMEKFVKEHNIKDYSIDIYNYTNEEDGIVFFAEDSGSDMIALGTNQRKGFNHFLTGSIAEDVVNHAKRPVWTFNLD